MKKKLIKYSNSNRKLTTLFIFIYFLQFRYVQLIFQSIGRFFSKDKIVIIDKIDRDVSNFHDGGDTQQLVERFVFKTFNFSHQIQPHSKS